MNMRDRLLAVLQGREHDRVPFYQYDGLAAPNEEIWSLIGRENMGVLRWSSVFRFEHPNCSIKTTEIERDDRHGERSILHTPAGRLVEEKFFEPTFGSASISRHFVSEPKDYEVLRAFLQDTIVCEDIDQFRRDRSELGEDGLPHVSVSRTPYQRLWVEWVSLEDLCFHLVECPDIVEECISLFARIERRGFEIVRKAKVPYVVFPDNITAPAIGPTYFEKYCVPFYKELSDMLADKGVPVFVHMDGDLKPLWDLIGESGIRGIESFSPPPDNDTTVAQAASMWPEIRTFVNFPSSVHLAEPGEVYSTACRILDEGGHTGRLAIGVSENVPPNVWRRSFPEIVRAIRNFGKP